MSVLDRYYYEIRLDYKHTHLGGDSYAKIETTFYKIYDRFFSTTEPIAISEQGFYAEKITKSLNNATTID